MEEFSVPVRTQTDEEGREETVLQNNVLPNVYDDWSEDQDGNRTPVDRTAEYDKLLTRYIEDRTLYEHNLIDTGYNDYIIEVFTGATASSPSGVQQQPSSGPLQREPMYSRFCWAGSGTQRQGAGGRFRSDRG